MIIKYVYGNPIQTNAVVHNIEATDVSLNLFKKDGSSFLYDMTSDDIVYGLGEAVRGMNKRGWIYKSFNADDPSHTEDKESLYSSHNFLLISGEKTFGVFVDSPGKVTFDIGYTNIDKLVITPEEENLVFYIIMGEDKKDIVKQFRKFIGKSYIPPLWAFGYQQSRWSYMNKDEVRKVVTEHRVNKVPLDAVYLDIDYMDNYKDFTVDDKSFGDFADFTAEMKEQGVRLVPIIDAGVKIEKGYDIYDEGVKNNYFCKDENGNDFVAAVWPGLTHFPDFFKEDTRTWFGDKYKYLTDLGIEGFWNDMNEPAIFYTKEKLKEAWQKINYYKDKELDINTFFTVRDIFRNLADYKEFYHEINGEKVRHDKVHNLYGFNMTKSASEGLSRIEPDKRFLLFSRSSYIGMHRYAGIWTGDNMSWWSHILLCLKQLPALNMCGFLYVGSDTGGFGANATEDLMLRWLALSVFTPLMRNHSAIGTREQEFYRFTNKNAFKSIISLRYQLLPYLYSEYMKAALNDEMMFRPLSFDYPNDKFAETVEDQLMVGDSIMIAPVYQQNAKGRYVYLPETMLMVRFENGQRKCKPVPCGHHFVEVDLDEVVFFIKENAMLPMSAPVQSTNELDKNKVILLGFVTKRADYKYYMDDGVTTNYNNKLVTFLAEPTSKGLMVATSDTQVDLTPQIYGGE